MADNESIPPPPVENQFPTHPNARLLNPEDGTEVFGIVPPLKLNSITTERAPIYLYVGRHIGPNRGGGAAHIWAEHSKDMNSFGFNELKYVPDYVKCIIRRGTDLHYEAGRMRGNERTSAVRARAGTAILEYVQHHFDGEARPYWRVITAFHGSNRHGRAVGRIE